MSPSSTATGAPGAGEDGGRGIRRLAPDVWGISVTSLFSDWSYEMVLPVLPFFLLFTLAATPFLVGLVDGAAQFAQSAVQTEAGERWARGPGRKRLGALGYLTTTVSHGLLAVAQAWPQALVFRVAAWVGRGARQPIKKAIVANATDPASQGIAFGLEQTLDSVGAVLGTLSAIALLAFEGTGAFRTIFAVSVVPGIVAIGMLGFFVHDRAARSIEPVETRRRIRWRDFPSRFRIFLVAQAVFGLGYFSILLALLRVGESLLPSSGGSIVSAVITSLLLYLLYNLIFTATSYPAGRWADRSRGVGLIAVSFVLFALVDGLLIVGGGILAGTLAFVVAGLQVGLQGVTESAWVARCVPAAQAGPAFGWLGLTQGITVLIGSLLVGGLWAYVSAPLAFGTSAVLSLLGAALLLPLLLPGAPTRPTQGLPASG